MMSQNSTIKYYILIITLSIFTLNSYAIYYQPSFETSFKLGKNRDIGRSSILIPLWQKEGQLLYFNAIGMMDNKNNQEGNFALGYRRKLDNNILGGYGYYDRKSSTNNNIFHQITLGLELLRENCEFRINGYIPINNKIILKETPKETLPKQIGGNFVIRGFNNQYFEKELAGFDIEGGVTIPKLPINLYLGYYYFDAKDVSTVQGPRLRGEIKLTDWLNITGEIQHDKPRGFNYFVGVELKANLGKKQDKLSVLDRKMTQKPVRDIDIVVLEGEELKEYKDEKDDNGKPIIAIDSFEKLKELSETRDDEKLSRTYVLVNDIDGARLIVLATAEYYGSLAEEYNEARKPKSRARAFSTKLGDISKNATRKLHQRVSMSSIGSAAHPFTGKFYGSFIGNDRKTHNSKVSGITIRGMSLFNYTNRAVISHLGLNLNFYRDTDYRNEFDGRVSYEHNGFASLIEHAHDTKIFHITNDSEIGVWEEEEGEFNYADLAIDDAFGGLIKETSGNTEIHNSCNRGTVSPLELDGGEYQVGGLVGINRGKLLIINSYNSPNPDAQWVENGMYMGGLIGVNEGYLRIANSYNNAEVSVGRIIGGLVGKNKGNLIISGSYNLGSVSYAVVVGGLVGENEGDLTIINSYNKGDNEGQNIAGNKPDHVAVVSGGLVGRNNKNVDITDSYNGGVLEGHVVGGLIGEAAQNSYASIKRSYNTGKLEASERSGELIGQYHIIPPAFENKKDCKAFIDTLFKTSPISDNVIKRDESIVNVSFLPVRTTDDDAGAETAGDLSDVATHVREMHEYVQETIRRENHPMIEDSVDEETLSKKLGWTFGVDKTWMMTENGPRLSWEWKQQEGQEDVLAVLREVNKLKIVKEADAAASLAIASASEEKWPFEDEFPVVVPYTEGYTPYATRWPFDALPLEKQVQIAKKYQKHGGLADSNVARIIDYHNTHPEELLTFSGMIESKKDMTKEQFLSYVYDDLENKRKRRDEDS